jgi:serine protease Do
MKRPLAPFLLGKLHLRAAARVIAIGALAALAVDAYTRAEDLAPLEQQAFNSAADAVADSVVQIRTVGGLDEVDNQVLAQGPTTGLIVSPDGYIVSSAFNFATRPTSTLVRLPDGQQAAAEIVGRDANLMLVLLKVESEEPLPVPSAAPMADVRVGDWAIAAGRTYQTDRLNVSVGIVSALARMHGRALQTDANVSAANYGGPLVDIRGRVLGILVPMAPQSGTGETSEVAGAEYYDSGIGFAVSLQRVLATLPRWIAEKDLKRGLLGIGMSGGNPHATPPTVSAVWPKSPAAKAGWQEGDRIISVDGEPVDSQTELRFQVVPRYAGDKLKIKLRRGKGDAAKEIDTQIELAAELEPFRHAFLGALPQRTAPGGKDADRASGIALRAVWPNSPADEAGLQPGDRITRLAGKKVNSLDQAIAQLNAKNPGDKLAVVAQRGDKKLELELKLGDLPVDILSPSDVPTSADIADGDQPDAGKPELQKLLLPEFSQPARYLAPQGDGPAPGLLLWLSDGKKGSDEALADAWETTCRRHRLALVIAAPADIRGWSSDDMEYLAQLLPAAIRRLGADSRRIVVGGQGQAGQLAYALAMKGRKLVRGAAVVDSPLPRTLEPPQNSPNERLAVLSVETQDSPLAVLIRRDLERLETAGYPTSRVELRHSPDRPGGLDAVTRGKMARWTDALDRF